MKWEALKSDIGDWYDLYLDEYQFCMTKSKQQAEQVAEMITYLAHKWVAEKDQTISKLIAESRSLPDLIDLIEREAIQGALAKHTSQHAAARSLGLKRTTFLAKVARHGLDKLAVQ
jgi:transcriptional regulator with GAF, ATPase, and Fis domain